ncbi:hypothetical protein CSA37_11995 [Candidatus Fermentibacteria bacterium]|nr:MAG: hypothetical protein CSA37_11995 [Candidatus Fermentibacteria bacterium]
MMTVNAMHIFFSMSSARLQVSPESASIGRIFPYSDARQGKTDSIQLGRHERLFLKVHICLSPKS